MTNFFSCNLADYYSDRYFQTSDKYVEYLMLLAKQTNKKIFKDDFIFVGHITHESYCFDDYGMTKYIDLFDSFKRKGIKNILVLNSFYKHLNLEKVNSNIYFLDFHIWLCWYLLIQKKISLVSSQWNSNGNKFLMLTGKPYMTNRIRLLWKLYHHQLLKKSIWSMFVHEGTYDQCRSLVPEMNDQEFRNFVKTYNNNADGADIQYQKKSLHYLGIPYDVKLYSDTLFRIIPETTFRTITSTPMITEKTYITMLNRLPFMIAGDTGSLKWLKTKGFKTFEHYLPIPDYDTIEDGEQRLDAITENCKHWLNNMHSRSDIEKDLEHNFHQMCKIARKNVEAIEELTESFGLGKKQPQDFLLDQGNKQHLYY